MNRACLLTGPGVGGENLVQRRIRNHLMTVHGSVDTFGNLREVNAPVQEFANGDFVGGVQNCGHRAAEISCPAGKIQRGESFRIGFLKGEAAQFGEVRLDTLAGGTLRIGQSILNWQAHVWGRKLRED